ncbi:hypothetical protein TEA_018860 [Camellia sinensis var. sinensis]|uniref:Sister chromatid cohesion protein n=1 Tax=Camellia sinensis var. sinensis TaxID=542762 RepID=A0A4S4E5U8_CAMSN|nr:hypothetical protein TEA_018860 [Camellia sinensis var. sinensis]
MAQQKLPQLLKDLGSKLENPPSTKDALVKLLKTLFLVRIVFMLVNLILGGQILGFAGKLVEFEQAATCLSELDQSPTKSILESMKPFLNAIVKTELLKHQDREVKLLVATNVCEITRITAPEAPYSDDVLKDIFHLIVSTFSGLSDTSGPSFGRRVFILETLARYRSCVVMLDLECDDLVNQMFSTFLSVTSDDHPESVLNSMQTIMVVLLEESEDVRDELLLSLLSVLGRNKSDVAMAARKLAMNVIEHCSVKLEPGVRQFLISSMSGDSKSLNGQIDYHEIIYDVYRCAPQILSGVVPFLTGELLTDQLDIRLKAVRLVGDLFALPDSAMSQTFQPIFSEFLKRLTDRVVEVRMSVLERAKICLLSNPFRAEASQVISALCDRLLDYDENVRKQVVAVICDVACNALTSIPVESVKLVAERLRDKSVHLYLPFFLFLLVKKYTMERLAEIYRVFCLSQSNGSTKTDDFDWIPGKILRCFYDKDFRSDTIEPILCGSLFPIEFSVKQKVGNWVRLFSGFDKVEVKALEKILEQKQRLQQEMQRYLSLRQMHQENDAPEFQKKILFCFRIMSRCFTDPAKAEDYFQILDQLKDANIWKILIILLDPNTSSHQACSSQDDLLKILGEKHRLYDFLSSLSLKCSYVLFNKEHVKEILLEADLRKSAGNTQLTLACMNILVILACFSPLLLSGIEKDLVHFLKDDNEVIKEGVLHVLAKAGGTIREQLGVSSSSLDLILEKICLEGSRRQAKYAVHALAAITKDDGLMSLSVLYKRLVNMLEEKTHLPAVLQSLGCIAQTAMSVFETRESELERFIKTNILECSNIVEDNAKECWDDRSKLCSLKIFGIKTLVKSYLPVKDAHLRLGIDGLFEILKNILSFGEITEKIESSLVDKAHLRLAAAKAVLRLSKHWDHKIHVDLFYLTLRTLEFTEAFSSFSRGIQISFPQAKKQFLNKVHQYIKERLLDPKYACAFLFDITGSQKPDFEEDKHNLSDIIQMCQQGKARQLALQSDANSSVVYPEYILPYLVYALSHHSSCPNVDECRDVKAFEPVYRPLHLFLSMLMHGDDDVKSEVSINKGQESISIIVSIFHCIKCSEDAADPAKSKNSYAICDLGMSITKRLAQKEDDLQGLIVSVPLPPMLYKPREKKEGDDPLRLFIHCSSSEVMALVVYLGRVSEGQTWLAEENVLTHFESLKLEVNGMIHPEVVDDGVLKDSETDGNDVPLGKIIKRLRAKGTKAKKMVKNESLPAGTEHEENVDILEMVREINLDNLGTSSKFESSNGHECTPKNLKIDQKHQKRKKLVAGETTNSPVPKRRRSSSAQGASKGLKRTSTDDLPQEEGSSSESPEIDEELHVGSEDKMSLQENVVEPAESDLLVSCFKKNSNSSSKHKSKNSNKDHNDEAHNIGEIDDYDVKKSNQLVETDSTTAITNSKFSSGSSKKRKRRSIAGLAKGNCSVSLPKGCCVPLAFANEKVKLYEGKKYLNRTKDKQKNGTKAVTKAAGSSPSKVRGKRSPRKNMKHGQKWVSRSETSPRLLEAEMSDAEPAASSKVDDMNSGYSEGERIDAIEKSLTGGEESDEEKSTSERKLAGDFEIGQSDAEESEGEMPNSEEKRIKQLEEKQQDESGEVGSIEEADKSEQSDSEATETDDHESNPVDPNKSREKTSASDSAEEELSDDEPLLFMKCRACGRAVWGSQSKENSRVQLTLGGDDEGHLGLCYTNKIQGAVVLGRSSCQFGEHKRNESTPCSRSTPQSSTWLAMRRQRKPPFKKTKTTTRSIRKPVVDPSKVMYRSNIAGVIKMVLEFNFGLPLRNSDIRLLFGIQCGKENLDVAQIGKALSDFIQQLCPNISRISSKVIKDLLVVAMRGNSERDEEDVVNLVCLYTRMIKSALTSSMNELHNRLENVTSSSFVSTPTLWNLIGIMCPQGFVSGISTNLLVDLSVDGSVEV